MRHSYDQLTEEIGRLQGELRQGEELRRLEAHRLRQAERRSQKLEVQLKTMQTLSLGLFSLLDPGEVYALACESAVYQLGWAAACVVVLHGERLSLPAAYRLTERQKRAVREQLGSTSLFQEAYRQRQAISTIGGHDRRALALRTLFEADEVVALPILFADQLYAYLIVCAQAGREQERTVQDVDFLAGMAGQIGHAVQNGTNFAILEEQNLKLRQLDDLKNSFISITSHQLRTPLSIIKWILSVLRDGQALQKAGLEEEVKLVGQAYESNERLIRVVNNLLNVSRIQEGRLPHNPQPTDLREMLEDLCAGIGSLCAQHGIRLDVRLGEGSLLLDLDPILIKESLQNLLDNAVAYNSGQGGFIAVGLELAEKEAVVTVENSGPGIAPTDQEKVFSQFYRSPEAVRIQPNGNGLGLYLCRAILREHGGEVSCQSQPGQTTTFTVRLPLPLPSEQK